jgi:hypothetical protein
MSRSMLGSPSLGEEPQSPWARRGQWPWVCVMMQGVRTPEQWPRSMSLDLYQVRGVGDPEWLLVKIECSEAYQDCPSWVKIIGGWWARVCIMIGGRSPKQWPRLVSSGLCQDQGVGAPNMLSRLTSVGFCHDRGVGGPEQLSGLISLGLHRKWRVTSPK